MVDENPIVRDMVAVTLGDEMPLYSGGLEYVLVDIVMFYL